ncbi:unnamed protein product [Periconia digitata]|uniref:Uncharacterized protein n=1 Tax=Periconia digitata TaxID=1303443 RepID=A0A9W4XUG5_9PLEO|nr:unnamed protein product [Periconia digitata]
MEAIHPRNILEDQPGKTWPLIAADEQHKVHHRINVALQREGIPAASEHLIQWRMAMAMRSQYRQSALSQSLPSTNSASRPYDPVRDL